MRCRGDRAPSLCLSWDRGRGVKWECRKPVTENPSVGKGKLRDSGQAGLGRWETRPRERLERRGADAEGYGVGNRTNPVGVGGAHVGLRPRIEP